MHAIKSNGYYVRGAFEVGSSFDMAPKITEMINAQLGWSKVEYRVTEQQVIDACNMKDYSGRIAWVASEYNEKHH
jgi:hypothetical protein